MDAKKQLFKMISRADRLGAKKVMTNWINENSIEEFVGNILLPVLEEVGENYVSNDEPPLAQAYVAAKVAQDGMDMVFKSMDVDSPAGKKGPVVLANIEDDFHSLSREILLALLTLKGWKVYDLGNDVPADEIVDKAVEVGAKIIGASAMMYITALNIKGIREELDRRGLSGKILLAVGGAVFGLRKGLIDEVGGDVGCQTALQVPALFENLLKQLEKEEL